MQSKRSTLQLGDKELARTVTGGTPDRSNPDYFGGKIRWVKSGELNDTWIYDTQEKITLEGLSNSAAKIHPAGTLLVAMYGATVGKTGILAVEAATNQAVCAIFPRKNSFDPQFLQFYFIHIRPELLRARSGGAQPNISKTIIDSLRIVLPDLAEQKAIAESLSATRDAIETRKLEIKLESERKAALMEHLFTHGTRGESTRQTQIGKMSINWQAARLSEFCERPVYGFTTSALIGPGETKFLRITDIQNEKVAWDVVPYCACDDEIRQKYVLKPGDILIARIGATTGKTYLVKDAPTAIFASYLIRIRTGPDLLPTFLSFYFQTDSYWMQIDQRKGGRLKGGINIPILENLIIPLPPLMEQQEISDILQACDAKISALENEIKLLNELFAAMLEELMTGKLAVKPPTEVTEA